MAEGVLFNIAERILGNLVTLTVVQEIGIYRGVKDELVKPKNTVTGIQAVILDADEKQALNEQVKDWLQKLKDVVYDADDLLDDFSTEALRQQMMVGNKVTKEVSRFFSSSNQLACSFKMGHKIKAIRERLDAIANDSQNLQLGVRFENRSFRGKLREETDSFPTTIVVGRGDKEAILKLLLASNNEENVSIISIVGIGGLGKTTLAQLIFNDELVQTHFDLKLWVCVSDPFNVKAVVKKILESASGEKPDDLELNILKESLDKIINGKKYLLLLDDVWNEDQEKWDKLKKFLTSGASRSKIIVTTRSTKVALLTSTLQPYVLNGPSNFESWPLLVKIVFKGKEPKNLGVIEIGKEIVKKCVGVPLAIKTIGSKLCFKNPETEWLPS